MALAEKRDRSGGRSCILRSGCHGAAEWILAIGRSGNTINKNRTRIIVAHAMFPLLVSSEHFGSSRNDSAASCL